MKNIVIAISLVVSTLAFSQIKVQGTPDVSIANQNPFLDASGYTQFDSNIGKGLYFPQTDLRTFTFNTNVLEGIDNFLTAYDGMIVYNTATGNTSNAQVTNITAVTPGFYYFSNPNDVNQGGTSIANGRWIRLGSDAASATAEYWSLKGNSGTTAGTNFIGTTDAQNVVFKSNSTSAGISDTEKPNFNPTKMILGNAGDTPAFTKVVIGGTTEEQTTALATKSKNVKPDGQTADAPFDFALEVYGKSWFKNGIVTSASTYPDYVFDNYFTGTSKVNPNYQFKTLAETEKFIKENNHLPGVTKIDDLQKGGNGYMIDQTQLSIQSLEKVEELYLHTIEQQKEIDALKAELAEIKALLKK